MIHVQSAKASKFQDISNRTPVNARIDPECNLICEFPAVPRKQRVSQKRRAVVDPRPALCGSNDYCPPRGKRQNQFRRYEGGRHEKSPLDSIRTRYIFSHRRYVRSRSPRECRNAYVYIRTLCEAHARGASLLVPSTDWRDGTLHPRHARCDTGCPSRRAVDWLVQAVIARL